MFCATPTVSPPTVHLREELRSSYIVPKAWMPFTPSSVIIASSASVRLNLACSLALVERPGEAVETLRQARDLGYEDVQAMREDPDLASLRQLPDFQKLAREMDATRRV